MEHLNSVVFCFPLLLGKAHLGSHPPRDPKGLHGPHVHEGRELVHGVQAHPCRNGHQHLHQSADSSSAPLYVFDNMLSGYKAQITPSTKAISPEGSLIQRDNDSYNMNLFANKALTV